MYYYEINLENFQFFVYINKFFLIVSETILRSNMNDYTNAETLVLHGGQYEATQIQMPSRYLSIKQRVINSNTEHAANLFALQRAWEYLHRIMDPTNAVQREEWLQ